MLKAIAVRLGHTVAQDPTAFSISRFRLRLHLVLWLLLDRACKY